MFILPSSVPDRFCGPPSLCQMLFSGRLTAFVPMPVVLTFSRGCDVLLGGLMKTTKMFSQDYLCSGRVVGLYLQSSVLLNLLAPELFFFLILAHTVYKM